MEVNDRELAPFYKRKYSESPTYSLDKGRSGEAFKLLQKVDPERAEQARKLFQRTIGPDAPLEVYRLINQDQSGGHFGVQYVRIVHGQDFPKHSHDVSCAFLYIVEGQGYTIVDGERHELEVGDCMFFPPGVVHEIVADPGPLAYIATVAPDFRVLPNQAIDLTFHE